MIRDIRRETELTGVYTGRRTLSPRVLEAMRGVPRHQFVGQEARAYAYDNGPLPIGQGQTISQPFIVALMTDLLDPQPGDRVLEVGTGSGYQAAILAELVDQVYTLEIIVALGEKAGERLARLGYENVHTRIGDGGLGWPEHAPYDGIIVTAAAPHIPTALLEQLKPDARLVIPVGPAYGGQELVVVEKDAHGNLDQHRVLSVVFVPLTGVGGDT